MSNRYLMRRFGGLLVIMLAVIFLSAGCATSSSESMESESSIMIFAAASMTDAVSEIVEAYHVIYPDVEILTNYAGSKTLRSQIENGADADIFISANEKHYQALLEQNLVEPGEKILENAMVIAVSNDSDAVIDDLGDLSGSCQLVLAESGVPAGDYARRILQKYSEANADTYFESAMSNVVSEESNVRQVLMKVALGEADAALVYRTDITDAVRDKVRVIEISDAYNVIGSYYMAVLPEAKEGTSALYDFIKGEAGDAVLEKYGFKPVTAE